MLGMRTGIMSPMTPDQTMKPNQKNVVVSQALSDLGLGDQVKQQLQDQLDNQKKKNVQAAGSTTMNMGATNGAQTMTSQFLSPAVSDIFGMMR